jgi:hypothetical protein
MIYCIVCSPLSSTKESRVNKFNLGPEGSILALALAMSELAHARQAEAVAIVAMPGLILRQTVEGSVERWNQLCHTRFLLVAGYHEEDVVTKTLTQDTIFDAYGIERREGVHTQGHARHTGEQAAWVAEKVAELGISSIALHVPAFHMPRNYLTVLEALRRRRVMIPIIPVMTPVLFYSPVVLNPADGTRSQCQLERMQHEATCLVNYSKPKGDGSPGDVATAEYFFEEYLPWLRNHYLVCDSTYI